MRLSRCWQSVNIDRNTLHAPLLSIFCFCLDCDVLARKESVLGSTMPTRWSCRRLNQCYRCNGWNTHRLRQLLGLGWNVRSSARTCPWQSIDREAKTADRPARS
jgi:hypothetical protein